MRIKTNNSLEKAIFSNVEFLQSNVSGCINLKFSYQHSVNFIIEWCTVLQKLGGFKSSSQNLIVISSHLTKRHLSRELLLTCETCEFINIPRDMYFCLLSIG